MVMRWVGCGREAARLGRVDEAVRRKEDRMGYDWFW